MPGLRGLLRVETLALALAIAILAAVGIVGHAAAQKPLSLDSYSTFDAGTGGYRAFYELLGREGIRVERFEQNPAFLDAEIAIETLVYVEPLDLDPRAHALTAGDIAALEAWVRGGGTLLYVGFDDVAARQGVLHLPRVTFNRARVRASIAPELRELGIARIASREPRRFATPRGSARLLLGDERGALVIAYPFGRGNVVAAIDRTLFTNAGMALGDRARLAVALARPKGVRDVLAFDETPHGYATAERWWSIVPRPFAVALAIALVALLVAIAGAALRLGPALVPMPRDDRTSADFVDAVASLFERNGEIRGTLAEATAATSRTIARTLGLDSAASNELIAKRIERADLRVSFVTMQGIAADRFVDNKTLVRGVALAQQLRKEFTAHGGSRN